MNIVMKTETIEDFYKIKFDRLPGDLNRETGHFNVFRLEDCHGPNALPVNYSRRDFYKISLIRGKNRYHYADKSVEISGSTLMFFNPNIPYTWESLSDDKTGFFCIFSKSFFTEKIRGGLGDLPMYTPGGNPAYKLDPLQDEHVSAIFLKMLDEISSDYTFKMDLIRNYVTELTHFALKSRPTETLYHHPDAKTRITAVFTELLERQFPIERPGQRLTMRSAKDYAEQLAVHVNHLNRAIKESTGKTTTHLIAERLTAEAKVLLKHTNWNISEIAYSLGFEDPAHFNNFFKKHTLLTPSSFRNSQAA
ncbi:helix-turn-helix domain-containing protein [Desertivirga xinjiangensis]|uniref:helix-turn-helix domain-containing protein n=1 Tax=Desertivirga xinjiangensis TaxID=539206 RepID=UPI00210A6AD8|nr:AraC family transcriptional regulator [Pedobacter xinjiangensis]